MKRVLKFREWDQKEHKMGKSFDMYKELSYDDNGFWESSCIFLQYTGCRDIKKKEIYEGDILRDNNSICWEVKFEDGSFWAINDMGEMLSGYFIKEGHLLIVGNIYENSI